MLGLEDARVEIEIEERRERMTKARNEMKALMDFIKRARDRSTSARTCASWRTTSARRTPWYYTSGVETGCAETGVGPRFWLSAIRTDCGYAVSHTRSGRRTDAIAALSEYANGGTSNVEVWVVRHIREDLELIGKNDETEDGGGPECPALDRLHEGCDSGFAARNHARER